MGSSTLLRNARRSQMVFLWRCRYPFGRTGSSLALPRCVNANCAPLQDPLSRQSVQPRMVQLLHPPCEPRRKQHPLDCPPYTLNRAASSQWALELLEPYDAKVSRTVPRGAGRSNAPRLLGRIFRPAGPLSRLVGGRIGILLKLERLCGYFHNELLFVSILLSA